MLCCCYGPAGPLRAMATGSVPQQTRHCLPSTRRSSPVAGAAEENVSSVEERSVSGEQVVKMLSKCQLETLPFCGQE